MVNPVEEGVVTSYCGERINPVTGVKEFHDGIDVAVAENTDAAAAADGKVTRSEYSPTWGHYVEYVTDRGYAVMYAHLNERYVQEGEKVKAGQVIAKTGNTGLSTGAHIHISIYKDGGVVDPLTLFGFASTVIPDLIRNPTSKRLNIGGFTAFARLDSGSSPE